MVKSFLVLLVLFLFSVSTQAATIDYLYESEMDLSSLGGSTSDDISLSISYDTNSIPESVWGCFAKYYIDGHFSVAGQIIEFSNALIITANNDSNIGGRDAFGIASDNIYTSMSGEIYGHGVDSFGFFIRGPSTVVTDTMLPANESILQLFDTNWNAIRFDGGPHLNEANTFFNINGIPGPNPGDANTNGKVNVSDLGILATNYSTTGGAVWTDADFTGDGNVDVTDLGILATNYGYGYGTPKASVPEPGTITLLLCGLVGLAVLRRQ